LEDKQINDVVDDLTRKYIDMEVEAELKRGQYEGTRSLDKKRSHVVGVRDKDADDYHLYITNLPRDELLPADLATIYRCQWEVETLFRELKTQTNWTSSTQATLLSWKSCGTRRCCHCW